MHCGPVTAGVIGTQRMQYDVWGDTVNVASRMESSGEAGRIHISEAFALNLKSNTEYTIQNAIKESRNHEPHAVPLVTGNLSLVTTFRGMIDIKGKGTMNTYWLEGTGR
jgi:class 3 adenylate cyclase